MWTKKVRAHPVIALRRQQRPNSAMHSRIALSATPARTPSGKPTIDARAALVTAALLAGCLPWLAGCEQAPPQAYAYRKDIAELDAKLQKELKKHLRRQCGTPQAPKLLGATEVQQARLKRGAAVYHDRCAACHGVTGDGNGEAAKTLDPRPRDYRKGIFKFISTSYGAKPLRADLQRIVRQGARGTAMPSFPLLSNEDVDAVVDYVLALTHRGELEIQLLVEAQNEEEILPERVPELVSEILTSWKQAEEKVVHAQTPEPPYTRQSVELGHKAFLAQKAGCFKCHGEDGRGQTSENRKGFEDGWGFKTRAADLTSGMLHGGSSSLDIYRRIHGGINGTPMPQFGSALGEQSDVFWHLVHYVQYLSDARRRQVRQVWTDRKKNAN